MCGRATHIPAITPAEKHFIPRTMKSTSCRVIFTAIMLILASSCPVAASDDWVASRNSRIRREIREGAKEIRKERREAFREVMGADSPREFRREIREGVREVRRERREMRREVRREIRRLRYW